MERTYSETLEHDVARHDAPPHSTSRHILTIKQAADLFTQHGVSRSPRSVQRFCELGNLDCIRVKGEKSEHYFINPISVQRYAEELKQLENISLLGTEMTRHDAPQRGVSRPVVKFENLTRQSQNTAPETDHEAETLRDRLSVLRKQIYQLKIDRAAKEQVIGQMVEERQSWFSQLTEQSRQIGRLETHMEQLAAPRHVIARRDATELVALQVTTIDPEQAIGDVATAGTPFATPIVLEPSKRSVWRRMFG